MFRIYRDRQKMKQILALFSDDVIIEFLYFQTRYKLANLQTTNRRLRRIIDNHFKIKPFLVFRSWIQRPISNISVFAKILISLEQDVRPLIKMRRLEPVLF